MTLTVVVAAIIVITLALALMAIPLGRRKAVAGGSQTGRAASDPDDWPEASSEWDGETQTRVIPREPAITWPKQLDPQSRTLDDAARLRLIEDLAVVHASWCVPVLKQAYEEERDPALRRAASDALNACGPTAAPHESV
jgi:hypothetical protein